MSCVFRLARLAHLGRLSRLARRATLGLVFAIAACAPETQEDQGSLVVGIQAEELGGVVGQLHVVAKIDGRIAREEVLDLGTRAPAEALPRELELTGPVGARAEVTASGFPYGSTIGTGSVPALTRIASAPLVAGSKKLLRVMLEQRCVSILGGLSAPICDAPTTCISGRCTTSDVPIEQLEPYEPGWAAAPPDACRPANHGAPEVIVGTGQTDYAPLAEDQTLQMELGPQGGHHIWIAVRMRNLRQSGSTTMVTSKLVDEPDAPLPPSAVVFSFERDEGSYCKLWGIRYQLDGGSTDLANDYRRLLGKRLAVTVSVTDSTKASASATRIVRIGDTLLCPDGTQACNQ